MASYGITATGFSVPRLPEIRASIIDDYQQKTGVQIAAKPNSVVGQLVDVMSENYLALWEEMYNAFRQLHPQYAEGNHLDIAAGYTSVLRKTEGKTTGYIRAYCDDWATIPAGTALRDSSTGATYSTDYEVVCHSGSYNLVKVEARMALDTAYKIVINGNSIEYNSGNSASATVLMQYMTARLRALGFTASSSGSILTIYCPPPQVFSIEVSSSIEITSTATSCAITATESGEYALSKSAPVSLESSVDGVLSIEVPLAGITGSAAESDSALRARYHTSNFMPGTHTTAAIRAAIENNVLGVEACKVFENNTSETDGMGRPAHSLHAVVKGGSSSLIGENILARAPAGISMHGSETLVVYDDYGEGHEVKFDRPEEMFIWIRMEVAKLPESEERYPSNSADIIKEAVVSGAQSDHGIGTDVVVGRLNSYAYGQSGVAYVTTSLYSTNDPLYTPSEGDFKQGNIEIKDNQIASFDAARVEII